MCVGSCPAHCVCTALLWVRASMCLSVCTVCWHTPVRAPWCVGVCVCEPVRVHVLHLRVTCLSNHVCHGCRDINACVHEGPRVCTCWHCWVRVCTPVGPAEVRVCPQLLTSLHRHPECLSRFAGSTGGNFCASHTCPCLSGAVCAHLLVHVLTEVSV